MPGADREPTPRDTELPSGTVLGRHRVLDRLAVGTHAILYLGEHVQTRAEVAIKLLRARWVHDTEVLARFDREAVVMGRLAGCRTVVQVHDAGALPDGRRYLVMERVRGRELAAVLMVAAQRGVVLELDRALAIASDIAAALRDAHGRDVVHRDLAPRNVMLAREIDGRETAKLIDFGVSSDRAARGIELTLAGATLGTPQYTSPEQAAGLPASPSMDLFGLGVMLFEMTTGVLPSVSSLRTGTVPPASRLRDDVPVSLDVLLRELLAADPRQRPGDAIAVLTRLAAIREQLRDDDRPNVWAEGRPVRAAGSIAVAGEAVTAGPRRRRPVHRRRRIAIAVAVLAIAFATGIAATLRCRLHETRSRDAAGASERAMPSPSGASDVPTRPRTPGVHRILARRSILT